MSEHDLEMVEVSIEQAKAVIELANTLDRLSRNKDFDAIIHKGYFEDEAVRLVMAKANPVMDTPELQSKIIKDIDAIGTLRQYFARIMLQGQQMERSLADDQLTREEILAENLSQE